MEWSRSVSSFEAPIGWFGANERITLTPAVAIELTVLGGQFVCILCWHEPLNENVRLSEYTADDASCGIRPYRFVAS